MADPAIDRIVTHDDLDGAVSAALVSLATGVDRFLFAGPVGIANGEVQTTGSDAVCDLPLPLRVGLWFDHHPGNLEDARLRGVDPMAIPGRFAPERSCARVVHDHYQGRVAFPPFIEATVAGTDRVDSFDYATAEEWRAETPERLLANSLFVPSPPRESWDYLGRLVALLKSFPMEAALENREVASRVAAYRSLEAGSLRLFAQDAAFLPDDPAREVVVVDLTRHNRRPEVTRAAAFLLHPEALAVLLVGSAFRQGKKTNDISVSMSLSYLMNRRPHRKDIGEIMRRLNIGDGHRGAGAGRIACPSKEEMLKRKARLVAEILRLWKEQS